MANNQPAHIAPVAPIPLALAQLIAVNAEHRVLICLGSGCRYAVRPAGFLRHISDKKHPLTKASRKLVREYIQAFPYDYTHSTIALPANRLAPQPILPIVDGFQC
jgi:hypothetical protein